LNLSLSSIFEFVDEERLRSRISLIFLQIRKSYIIYFCESYIIFKRISTGNTDESSAAVHRGFSVSASSEVLALD
jgi:hypothetical protein